MTDANPLNLAVSSTSFHTALSQGRMVLDEVPAAIIPLGFHAVELNDRFLRTRPAIKQQLLDWLMRQYFGAGAFYREYTSARLLALHESFSQAESRLVVWTTDTDFTLDGKAARWQMNYLEGAIAAANDFGARLVCVQAGGPADPSETTLRHCIDSLKQATQLAQRFHTRLALQHGSGLASTTGRTLQLYHAVNSSSLGICLELGMNDPMTALVPYTILVRARSFALHTRDDTQMAIATGLHALQAARYGGWTILAYDGDGDPGEGIQQLAAWVRGSHPGAD